MMSAAYPLRSCVRAGSKTFSSLRVRSSTATGKHVSADGLRCTTTTPNLATGRRWASGKSGKQADDGTIAGMELYDGKRLQHMIDDLFEKAGTKSQKAVTSEKANALADSQLASLSSASNAADRIPKKYKTGQHEFWNEGEDDPDYISEEVLDEEFNEDDILSGAHGKLEEHREMREYARLAIYDMPLLSNFAKPFEPPTRATPLRWRYTSYMGEFHPAEKKVVVEFCPEDFGLTEVQVSKLKKLAGPRYNPEKGTIKMSCENFEHAAQNKRYLGDLAMKLIAEAKDPKDTFEDIPLDTRHHTIKAKPKFPREWRMTEDRKAQLVQSRHEAYLLDQAKKSKGALIDGSEVIKKFLEAPAVEEVSAEEKMLQFVRTETGKGGGNRPAAR
ncbi:hypothetical protein MCOR25_007881 [Pyricularia grisea]|uniref:Small ribosomal subunit protein mS35 mitochondrial conserved domain-containing protein n=1 Tax=Pyricularia grisea TaxID=148305 RepID=A0A6P8B2K8_PYRGI|nr:uncharacterized protein PgNI_07700 [Pyricularia grisea]KAI6356709.1 hypothetical protein MCOR25_007881 [Pyricularia grisea]TLD09034.1 hypothetical protein PgNI_07700 [Pyricularia grisea]